MADNPRPPSHYLKYGQAPTAFTGDPVALPAKPNDGQPISEVDRLARRGTPRQLHAADQAMRARRAPQGPRSMAEALAMPTRPSPYWGPVGREGND